VQDRPQHPIGEAVVIFLKVVAVARGNEKGRVERAIRYVRDNSPARRTNGVT
jgi:hypothetical protein